MAAQAHRLHEKEISWWLCQMVRDWGHSTQISRPAKQGGQVLESTCPWRLEAGYLKRWWNKNQTDIYHLVDLQLLILIQLYWNVFSLQSRMNNHTKTTHHHTGWCRILLLHGFLPWDGLFWMEISPPCKWMNNSNHKLDLPLQGFSSAKNMFHEFHGILVMMRNRILARGQIGIKTS